MNITFLGATKMVTGSNFLVEGAGKRFLVDCGMYQGKATDEMENEFQNYIMKVLEGQCMLQRQHVSYVQ